MENETFLDVSHQIHRLKQDGNTLEVIGRMFGMTKQAAGYYSAIVQKLVPDVLEFVENTLSTQFSPFVDDAHSRDVDDKSTRVDSINWETSWFRHITPLRPKYQRAMVARIRANTKSKITTDKVEAWKKLYQKRQAIEDYLVANVPSEFIEDCIQRLDEATYDKSAAWDKEAKQYEIKAVRACIARANEPLPTGDGT